jgi:DNA-binding CsgD family transcriptional regulator
LTNVVTITEATEERVAVDFAAAFLARVEAARGMEDACREHAAAALATASRLGIGAAELWARHALAVLALGAGRPADAVEHLDRIAADTTEWGIAEPGVLWWQADHVVALVACRREEEAREAAARLDEDALRTGRGFACAAAAWCRAVLCAADCDPEADFAAALDGFQTIGAQFERARVLLARGRARIRRATDDAGGRRDLAECRTIFDRLGARAWAEQARAALGEKIQDIEPTLAMRLTPAELRVALAVGGGASNREAADQLFVSLKTVDFHLQNIYRKLDVHSRTQLAALVAKETAIRG